MKKFLNIPVFEFLHGVLADNTESYHSDFELDKKVIYDVATGNRLGGNVLLWMSRQHGTQCVSEYEAFVKDSPAYTTWRYYANDSAGERVKAYTVEVLGVKDGIVYGNVYQLDYIAHVADMVKNAVEALEVQKVFEDGYVDRVSPERSCYGYYVGLTEEHGPIVDSLYVPAHEAELSNVLAAQKRVRDKFRVVDVSFDGKSSTGVVDDLLRSAEKRSMDISAAGSSKTDFVKE